MVERHENALIDAAVLHAMLIKTSIDSLMRRGRRAEAGKSIQGAAIEGSLWPCSAHRVVHDDDQFL
jgi:hypothetical protein